MNQTSDLELKNSFFLLALILPWVMGLSTAKAEEKIQKLSVHTVPYSEKQPADLNHLTKDARHGIVSYFNDQNKLVQERYSYKTSDNCNVEVILAKPRVDFINCPPPKGAFLQSFGPFGEQNWSYTIREKKKTRRKEIFGATEEGIVLYDLNTIEVLDPLNGKILFQNPSRMEYKPQLTVTRSLIYSPIAATFYYYEAEVSLIRKKGGLFRLEPPYEKEEKLLPLKWGLLGHVSIEAMAISRNNEYLFLGKRWRTRGAGWVDFSVYDLKKGEELFSDRVEEQCGCHDLKITVGKKGKVALSYYETAVTKTIAYQLNFN